MSRPDAIPYRDPLALIWLDCAASLGLRIEFSHEVFASYDGNGTLTLAASDWDPDDSLAQMIFHEICHWLVQGEVAYGKNDWGLCNESEKDFAREHACLRLQATLTARHGLRHILAPTTDFRVFYDALPDDPLEDRSDESARLAILAIHRSKQKPWHPHLEKALAATASIAEITHRALANPARQATSVFDRWQSPTLHPTSGFRQLPAQSARCAGCAFFSDGNCHQAQTEVLATDPACERFEAPLDCQTCGACCREGFDSVTVDDDDPVHQQHPDFLIARPGYVEVKRKGSRCAALCGDGGPARFTCQIYPDRPRVCRELQAGSVNCLLARRRVGLSL